ncbi:MAG: YbaB/EbfC family nucleoid-associated protein [Chlamydiota bacterium]|nr:YbaB/EbfC family nucleoid-associated protein [Chlamydiota bacterium]
MGTGFNKRKKQAKMMQEKFMKMQEQLKELEVTGSAANGLVEVSMNGENEVTKVKIKPECVDPDDVEGLEDLLKAACNDAQEKLKNNSPMGMGGAGGMPNIPGMPDLSSLGL